jgi:hypothetical protein
MAPLTIAAEDLVSQTALTSWVQKPIRAPLMLVFGHLIDPGNHVESGNENRSSSKASPALSGNFPRGRLLNQSCQQKKAVKAKMSLNLVGAKQMTAALQWRVRKAMLARMEWSKCLIQHLLPALLFLLLSYLLSLLPDEVLSIVTLHLYLFRRAKSNLDDTNLSAIFELANGLPIAHINSLVFQNHVHR